MSIGLLLLVLINAAAVLVGTIVGGPVWFFALLVGFLTVLLLWMHVWFFIVPATFGFVVCGPHLFTIVIVLMLIDILVWYYKMLRSSD